MMKTPEEIKKALKRCGETPPDCNKCPYDIKGRIGCKGIAALDALALIEQLEARIPRWISVEERLPKCVERVLITDGVAIFEAYLSISHKWVRSGLLWQENVTHWMPLPEPPKEEEKEE